ncbi:MAG: TonB-dependent receptor [Bacteroidales bacterium]|nr:TonB-dependent receptor [Bacteroidales bacterium]
MKINHSSGHARPIGSYCFAVLSFFFAACLLSTAPLSAQSRTRTLSGHVYDAATGEPIPGVAVMQQATNIGSVTDIDGAYVLGVTDIQKGKIVVSAIGYRDQTIEIGGRTQIDIRLEIEAQSLDDVVVVGYGAQKKATVTGALTTVESKALTHQATTTLSNALGGVVPGIVSRQVSGEPGYDSANLLIRGLGTWVNATPLVLVDGVERDINLISANEIESFSVLKDASATAVYGMRGANGVILINTKKGTMGRPKVVFKSEMTNLHGLRFQDNIESYEFATLMNEACMVSGNIIPWSDEEIEKFRDGSDPYLYPNVDWTDAILKKNAFQTIDELSVSGGNEIIRYFVNVGFSSQSGLFKEDPTYSYRTNSLSQRYNFRTNLDINLSRNLILNIGLAEIVEDRTYPGTSASAIFNSLKLVTPLSYPMVNPDGSLGGGNTSYEWDSPWRLATNNGFSKQYRSTTQGTVGLKWDLGTLITPGLSLEGNFSYDHVYVNEVSRRKTPTIKKFLGWDDNGEERYNIIKEETAMTYGVGTNYSNRAYYGDVRLNYNRTFAKHTVGLLAMGNWRDFKDLTTGSSVGNLPYRRQGWAGRASYNYDQRYLAEFNFGYNGSENFAKGLRYGFFPAFSAGWVPSNEKFWGASNPINHFKIRGSYGLVGNDSNSADRFFYMSTVNKTANGYLFGDSQIGKNGMAELSMGSPLATWEVSHKTDVGLDMEMFQGKFKLSADYFYEYRDQILLKRAQIPDIMGAAWGDTPWANVGIMENRGIDGNIEFTNTTKKGFYYSLRGNVTFARNKIVEDDTVYHTFEYQDTRGRSAGLIYGLEAMGLFQSQEEIDNAPKQEFGPYTVGDIRYVDQNGDGLVNSYDYKFIGYGRTPEVMFGFGWTFAYKGFDLTMNFTGATNTNILLDYTSMWPFMLDYPGYNICREYYDNRFIPGADNSNAKYPVVHAGTSKNNFTQSTLYMRDASYLKLKTMEFGYTFPKKVNDALHLSSLRLFLNGNNVFCLDKVKLIDPETEHMGDTKYPTQRALTFGLTVGF